jgi:hypothetical protein
MIVTDQPGRIFAVIIFAPYIVCRGLTHRDTLLIVLGVTLFLYEMFWLLSKPPKMALWPLSAEN